MSKELSTEYEENEEDLSKSVFLPSKNMVHTTEKTSFNTYFVEKSDNPVILFSLCQISFNKKMKPKNGFIQLIKKGKDEKCILSIHLSLPITKSTECLQFHLNGATVKTVAEEKFVLQFEDLKLIKSSNEENKLSFECFCVKLLNQPYESQWIFLLKLHCGIEVIHLCKSVKNCLLPEEKPKEKKEKRRGSILFKSEIESGYKKNWKDKHYEKWNVSEVQKWLGVIKFSKELSFREVIGKHFQDLEIDGQALKEIKKEKEIKSIHKSINFLQAKRLYHELLDLRANDGIFNEIRSIVLQKVSNNTDGPNRSLEEWKRKMKYAYDKKTLSKTIKSILFDIEENSPNFDDQFKKIIANPAIKYFQFQVKVLAVVIQSNPNFIEKIGMKLFGKKFETFFHLGLIIKNCQLDWYSNEIVSVRKVQSKNPILCCDIDCISIEKSQIKNWINNLSEEILRWNKECKYSQFSLKKEQPKHKANCQDFVFRMMRFLNVGFEFPESIRLFFKKMKKIKQKKQMEIEFTPKFFKAFKLHKGLEIGNGEEKQKLIFVNDRTVLFTTHKMIDNFFFYCEKQGTDLANDWVNYYQDYELLRSFDTAFHIGMETAVSTRNTELYHICEPSSAGCGFNVEIKKEDLFKE